MSIRCATIRTAYIVPAHICALLLVIIFIKTIQMSANRLCLLGENAIETAKNRCLKPAGRRGSKAISMTMSRVSMTKENISMTI